MLFKPKQFLYKAHSTFQKILKNAVRIELSSKDILIEFSQVNCDNNMKYVWRETAFLPTVNIEDIQIKIYKEKQLIGKGIYHVPALDIKAKYQCLDIINDNYKIIGKVLFGVALATKQQALNVSNRLVLNSYMNPLKRSRQKKIFQKSESFKDQKSNNSQTKSLQKKPNIPKIPKKVQSYPNQQIIQSKQNKQKKKQEKISKPWYSCLGCFSKKNSKEKNNKKYKQTKKVYIWTEQQIIQFAQKNKIKFGIPYKTKYHSIYQQNQATVTQIYYS